MNVGATLQTSTGEIYMKWAQNVDGVDALLAVAQLIKHGESGDPFAEVVAIHVNM